MDNATKYFLFLDTETTGLDHQIHYPWEVYAQLVEVDWDNEELKLVESPLHHVLHSDVAIAWADPVALEIGNWYTNYPLHRDNGLVASPGKLAHKLVKLCGDKKPVLTGRCPYFDDEMIRRHILEPLNVSRPWHYHFLDLENLANGLSRALYRTNHTTKTKDLEVLLNMPKNEAQHTAKGDVEHDIRLFKRIYSLQGGTE